MSVPTVLAVDGNSLVHRAFHASARTGFRDPQGRPAWAVRGLIAQIAAAADRVCADRILVGFDDPQASERRDRWPGYKAHRAPKPDTLHDQLALARDVLVDLGIPVVVPPGLEADDVLASVAAQAPQHASRTVLVTSDRDSFALVDQHTRLLRILNGGVDASPILDPDRMVLVAGVRPDQYLDLASLRGDASDNLPGVRGFGPKTAAGLLTEFGTAELAFADATGGGGRCQGVIGPARTRTLATPEARAQFDLNREVMTMARTVDVGLDRPGGQVPLDERAVSSRLQGFDLGYAVRSLCLLGDNRPPPSDAPRWVSPPPRRSPAPVPRREPDPAPSAPAYVQEALF